MLHAMGFDRAAVLDGGFEKWVAEGRPISREACSYAAATFTPRPRPGLSVDKGQVLAAIDDPGVCLINTLSEPDFRGVEPSRYGRPGHIPGSVNLPWPELSEPEPTCSSRWTRPRGGSRPPAPIGPSASSATAAAASRRRWGCFSCTASVTTTSRSTTPRWPNGRATRACRSSAGDARRILEPTVACGLARSDVIDRSRQ